MNFQTASDIPIIVTVPSTSNTSTELPRPQLQAERRINPSWTLSQLKAKLEPVTGIPPGCQRLRIRAVDGSWVPLTAQDDDEMRIGESGLLRRGGEMEVHDTRPPLQRVDHLFNATNDAGSAVEKYTMPTSQYEQLPNSVLAWKRQQKLGRFDPSNANDRSDGQAEEERRARDWASIKQKGTEVGRRCCVGGGGGGGEGRRGQVRFVGEVEGLGGDRERGACWVGVECDEPVGKNDGSVVVCVTRQNADKNDDDDDDDDDHHHEDSQGESGDTHQTETIQEKKRVRLFDCRPGFGLLVRLDKVEVGDQWVPLDDLEMDADMEEL